MGFFKDLLRNGLLGHHGRRSHHGDYGTATPYYGTAPAPGRPCRSCNAHVTAGANFCGQCGASVLPANCRQCGTTLAAGVKFCGQCGATAGG